MIQVSRFQTPIIFFIAISSFFITFEIHADSIPAEKNWIYFTDKGSVESDYYIDTILSDRSIERRNRLDIPFDILDLPVNKEYITNLSNTGAEVHRISRWLNAVSVSASNAQLVEIEQFPFVVETEPVATLVRAFEMQRSFPKSGLDFPDSIYGNTLSQLRQLRIDQLHRMGFTGKNVLMAFFDTGYYLDHGAFDSLRSDNRLIATYDFINNDEDVQDANDIQRRHGTSTFSIASGYSPGTLIGGAFGADFALAKTEIVSGEYQLEEDNWVAAAEWADSIGADIISTSLGYNAWYDYDDMDGNTAVTTVAADIAASRGILVVCSAGNEGDDAWRYILAPADGDSVIAVGAVNAEGIRRDFSSVGPTSDGRIKPDIMALGQDVYCASFHTPDSYIYSTGTSVAAPLGASAAALILQAKSKQLNPQELMDLLHVHSSQSSNPDTLYGWGIPDAFRASGTFVIGVPDLPYYTGGDEIPVHVSLMGPDGAISGDSLEVHTQPESGLELLQPFQETIPGNYQATLRTTDIHGEQYITVFDATRDVSDSVLVQVLDKPTDFSSSFHNYPNPFKRFTNFSFNLPEPASVEIVVFTVAGEKVRDIKIRIDQTSQGLNSFRWNADNNDKKKVSGGVFICRIYTPWYEGMTKVVKID
ncbi:MAG: S8 family serine peptidase [candidate division Zixibacteria bacterium]|nr:S8 family serine peptidase [candidate division Zixibacteria bacterium]